MKTSKYHIFCSWLLLLCFVAGQYMVYAHQHNIIKATGRMYGIVKTTTNKTVTEKCALCDAMHHTVMVIDHLAYFIPVTVTEHVFKSISYRFTSIQLIMAAGRAPPTCVYSA